MANTDNFQVLIQTIIDAKDVQSRLNAIKDLSVKIEQVNLNQSAINSLRDQLSKHGIDINLTIGNSAQLQSQAVKVGQQIGQTISSGINSVIQKGDFRKTFGNTFGNLNSAGKEAEKYFQTLSNTVSVQEKLGNDNNLKSFTVSLKNADGIAEQLKYTLKQIEDGNGNISDRWFEYTGGSVNDNGVIKQFKMLSTAADNLQIKLEKLKANYSDSNAPKAIKNSEHISSLNAQYEKVLQSISNLRTADNSTFSSMQSNTKSEIATLENLIQQYRNAENVSIKLKGTDLSSGLSIAKNDLDKFKADAKDFPQITKTIKDLDDAISRVGNAASLNKFNDQLRVARSELAKVKSETTFLNRNSKVGINVSGLQSKISDIQRISPQIDNFKTQINGAEVSIQSLLEDLLNVNTQGDFSVINSKFKAFTDSAKAAGIAVSDIVINTARLEGVKHSIDNGAYSTQIEKLKSQFQQYGLSVGDAENKVRDLRTTLSAMESASDENLTKEFGTWRNEIKNVKVQLDQAKLSFDKLSQPSSQEKISATLVKIKTLLQNNTKVTKEVRQEWERYVSRLTSDSNISEKEINDINVRLKQTESQMRGMGRLGLSWSDSIKKGIGSFSTWISATTIFMSFIRAFKSGVNTSRELNSALTNINYTMDVSSKQLSKIGRQSIDTAKNLRTSAKNVLDAVTTYANANETAEGILSKSKPTIMLSNVTDMDPATTTDILQGTIHQFNLEDTEEELYHVSDVLQAVSQSMAVDFSKGIKEIAEGIQVSGSVAKDAGYDIEAYASILGNLIEKTRQSGSELGRSLRTMFVRTTKASSSALAGGEVSEEDLSKAEAALRRVGIEVRDTKDSFRNFDDIMTDLYHKIDTLSEIDLSNIAYEVASTRQTAVFKVMVKTWGDYLNLSEKAYSASGETLANQEKYVESLEGKYKGLGATVESIYTNLFKSDDVGKVVDGFQLLANVIDTITEKLGLFGTASVAIGAALGFKNVGAAKLY